MNFKYVRKQVIEAIHGAEACDSPWPHFRVSKVFPDDFYSMILANLPKQGAMNLMNIKQPNRYFYWLEQQGKRPEVSRFWHDFRENLFDDIWLSMEDRVEAVGTQPGAELVHDLPGYQIRVHTDTADKLITGLFYLPKEAATCGTVLYEGSAEDETGKGKVEVEFSNRTVIPFEPNTALFFRRTNKSWHGVDRTPIERWSLAFDVFR